MREQNTKNTATMKNKYDRKYTEEHYDAAKQKECNEKYQRENKQKIQEYRKKRYAINKEELCEKQRAYHVANRESILEKMNEYRSRNIEQIKQKHTCDVCGGTYQNKSKHAHVRTMKHQQALQK